MLNKKKDRTEGNRALLWFDLNKILDITLQSEWQLKKESENNIQIHVSFYVMFVKFIELFIDDIFMKIKLKSLCSD